MCVGPPRPLNYIWLHARDRLGCLHHGSTSVPSGPLGAATGRHGALARAAPHRQFVHAERMRYDRVILNITSNG